MILGFSNFLRATSPFYYVDLPSFQRDFASLKTLDHGTGPNITFTRASDATFFDADGVLQTAGTNVPRFDHDPAAGALSRGLLIEEARTNSIRNSQAGGSTNGVIGSGGVLPTNWEYGPVAGITLEVLGTGTTGGFTYVDVKFAGTNSSGTALLPNIRFEGGQQIVAANTQSWTGSFYVATVGTPTGVTSYAINIDEIDSTGNNLNATSQAFTPTASLSRIAATRTMNNASCAFTRHRVVVSVADGATIDLTLRIAAPQLEQGAFATSYIPTTTAAATRAADSAVVTPIASFYNQAEGTLFAEALTNVTGSAASLLAFHDTTNNNSVTLFARRAGVAGAAGTQALVRSSGADQTAFGSVTYPATDARIILAYKADDVATSLNGAAALTDTSATIPTLTHARIGGNYLNAWNGHIRKIAYWPKRLTNTLLEQLTT
jgi:hypothetical protein